MKMMRVEFKHNGELKAGCYSEDEAKARVIWALTNSCTDIRCAEADSVGKKI